MKRDNSLLSIDLTYASRRNLDSTRRSGRYIRALSFLATSDIDLFPRPLRAVCAEKVDICSVTRYSPVHIVDRQVSDGHAGGGLPGRAAVLVILLDDDTIIRDARQCDVFVRHARHGPSGSGNGLDAYTWQAEISQRGCSEKNEKSRVPLALLTI